MAISGTQTNRVAAEAVKFLQKQTAPIGVSAAAVKVLVGPKAQIPDITVGALGLKVLVMTEPSRTIDNSIVYIKNEDERWTMLDTVSN